MPQVSDAAHRGGPSTRPAPPTGHPVLSVGAGAARGSGLGPVFIVVSPTSVVLRSPILHVCALPAQSPRSSARRIHRTGWPDSSSPIRPRTTTRMPRCRTRGSASTRCSPTARPCFTNSTPDWSTMTEPRHPPRRSGWSAGMPGGLADAVGFVYATASVALLGQPDQVRFRLHPDGGPTVWTRAARPRWPRGRAPLDASRRGTGAERRGRPGCGRGGGIDRGRGTHCRGLSGTGPGRAQRVVGRGTPSGCRCCTRSTGGARRSGTSRSAPTVPVTRGAADRAGRGSRWPRWFTHQLLTLTAQVRAQPGPVG